MKWNVEDADKDEKGHHLGRRCKRCKSSGDSDCQCSTGGGSDSCTAETCKCALAGKCCKCYCKGKGCGCSKKECICIEKDTNGSYYRIYNGTYQSAYTPYPSGKFFDKYGIAATWIAVEKNITLSGTPSQRRHQCACILLGSVCLIWSGITYMYWTGKYHSSSPRWNNHILDGSGLDDGTLSQWLQALGFPREMLNDAGPGNRMDAIIWDGIREKLFWGFTHPSGSGSSDYNDNTAKYPAGLNYAGFVHTIHRDSFNNEATVFPNGSGSSTSDGTVPDQHKRGALYKLYILSCAYFTGLQKRRALISTNRTTNNPKTIREILYWLSALPYSQAYPNILKHGKKRLEKVLEHATDKKLKFIQTDRPAPITVDEYNLFAHFQAVTQYCPLVLIGIQGGLKGADSTKEPAIHALYSNSHFSFTYPAVDIQAYNQVVHYIRALFYQLYFLRKQCAVKVTCGGKWRECRYGKDVVSEGVISWMCLGCNPMEHDRKWRVTEMGNKLNKLPLGTAGISKALRDILTAIGEVVVQLGNAQEALEGKDKDAIGKVKDKLTEAKGELDKAKNGVNGQAELTKAKAALDELTKGGSSGILGGLDGALRTATGGEDFDQGKNKISEAIHKVRSVMEEIQKELGVSNSSYLNGSLSEWVANTLHKTIEQLISICTSPKCSACDSHSKKCGQPSTPTICKTCHQPTTTGVPSPLQAFLEDRLPGFSCSAVVNDDKDNPTYPPAASHLGHCNGSGQCCPLPMGFRGQFQGGGISDMTGARLYGILYFFSNGDMMQSCVYTLVRVTAALSATTPQVLGDVFGFFRGGVGNNEEGMPQKGNVEKKCDHTGNPSETSEENKEKYFCGWCASGLREEVKKIEWIPKDGEAPYRDKVGNALRDIKGDKGSTVALKSTGSTTPSSLSTLTDGNHYVSPLTGELYTAVSATFGGTYLSWVLYLSDALEGGLKSLASEFKQIECRGCKGQCDPNKCKKGSHGTNGESQCKCQSIVSCTGVLPVLYRHGLSYCDVEALHYSKGEFY